MRADVDARVLVLAVIGAVAIHTVVAVGVVLAVSTVMAVGMVVAVGALVAVGVHRFFNGVCNHIWRQEEVGCGQCEAGDSGIVVCSECCL